MENTPHTFPPANASLSSSVLSLCPTAATLLFLPGAYTLSSSPLCRATCCLCGCSCGALFFVFYLLVLLSHMTVLRHIRRSRHGTRVTTSQSLLGRVLRNIVVIQVVLSVCLLPYHIFKPIFISLAIDQHQLMYSPRPNICNHCHPLATFVELKNCLLLLAALRGATDPLMYYLLDTTFRHQTLRLLRCNQNSPRGREMCSVMGSDNQRSGHLEDVTVDLTQGSVL